MSFYETLLVETAGQRAEFLSVPLIGRALSGAVSRGLYLDFLGEAYHHVRHTCPLLSLAASRTSDRRYRDALFAYIQEERGHEDWILDDVAAAGGDVDVVVARGPRLPCRLMVAYAYYAIDWISPYALLGMVHVLEGMSVRLAGSVADVVQRKLDLPPSGVRYLRSHGALDQDHVAFFRGLVDGIDDAAGRRAIVECASIMYRLYGDMFRDIGARYPEEAHAA